MFGPGIYSSVVSKANLYSRNHHVRSHKHVLIICGLDPGNSVDMTAAGIPGPCDSVEGLTKAEGGTLEYQESVVYDPARLKPLGLVVYMREGDKSPEDDSVPLSPMDENISMRDSDSTISETEPAVDLANMPRIVERRPGNIPSNASGEYQTYKSECINRASRASRAIPQSPIPPVSTKMIVELSPLERHTPFSKRVEHLFYDSWLDQTKGSHVKEIILFDIKTVPYQPDGQTPGTFKRANRDPELLTLLGDFPLRFYGARRACYIGDLGYPLDICHDVECATCSVFRDQYAAREAGMGFELGPEILTSSSSSQADALTTNHHIRSSQHAMILCACPNIAQSDHQTVSPDPYAPPPYTASASPSTVVVPIGLIMYTRTGWHI
ncbi:hypothetical protein N7463_000521 [Penicillium fimorum]|uniref:PARP catalytic domain-containing protein n=1 Tax=Penicillium fimorum TaxID=1882269 RepID=A0A9W9Y590_9EURO|nr:hypothetical protein N7463_000521 [Penicillium fimorum]